MRQGASQDGVSGSRPPALCVNISFSLAHMRHYATQSHMKSTIHKNTSHAQCNAEHRDGSTTAGCADVQKKSVAFHPEVSRMDLAVLSDVKRMMQHLHARLRFSEHMKSCCTPLLVYFHEMLSLWSSHVSTRSRGSDCSLPPTVPHGTAYKQ